MIIAHFLDDADAVWALWGARRVLQARSVPAKIAAPASWEELKVLLGRRPETVPVVNPYHRAVPALPDQLADQVLEAGGHRVLERLMNGLEQRTTLSWKQRIAIRWAVRNGWRACSTDEFARGVGVSPRTLRAWFGACDELSPGRLLSWGRVLWACRLITVARTDPPVAARLLGFSSYSDLCRRYRRLIGRRLPEDAGADPLGQATEALVSAVGNRKHPPSPPGGG